MAVDFIPEKFYVTRQPRGNSDEVLGFMVPMHKDGYTSRKATADHWARGRGVPMAPIEVENKPLSGFSLTENKRRMMNKNVIWRCIHPEGFEFEITSDNFSDFLMEIDMKQGIIQTEMIFIRRSGENYLTWVGSPAHKEAVTQASLEVKVSLKDLKIGDKFTQKNGTVAIYRGSVHVMGLVEPTKACAPSSPKHCEISPDQTSDKLHYYNVIHDSVVDTQLSHSSSLTIVAREEQPTTHTIDTLIDEIKAQTLEFDGPNIFAVRTTKFKASDLTVELVEIPVDHTYPTSVVYKNCGKYGMFHRNILVQTDDSSKLYGYHVGYAYAKHPGHGTISTHVLQPMEKVTLANDTIAYSSIYAQVTSRYYHREITWRRSGSHADYSGGTYLAVQSTDIVKAYRQVFSFK